MSNIIVTEEPTETYLETIGEPINQFEIVPIHSHVNLLRDAASAAKVLAEGSGCEAVASLRTSGPWKIKEYGRVGYFVTATGLRKRKSRDHRATTSDIIVTQERPALYLASLDEPIGRYEIVPIRIEMFMKGFPRILRVWELPNGISKEFDNTTTASSPTNPGDQFVAEGLYLAKKIASRDACECVTSYRCVLLPTDWDKDVAAHFSGTGLRKKG